MARRAAADNVLRITQAGLARLVLDPGQTDRVWWDADLAGLGYRLRGTRGTWVVRPPRFGGKSALITLGAADALSVIEARRLAQARIGMVSKGEDPRADRRRERKAPALTLGKVFESYTAAKSKTEGRKPKLRDSTLANLRTHVNKHFADLHAKEVATVTRADVAKMLRDTSDKSGEQAALRARRTLSTIFSWAIGEGMTETNPVIGTNAPAEDIRRDRVLSRDELIAVWNACPPDGDFGRIVRLLVLTGQRRDEVAGMLWSEVDIDAALWRLPPERTKNGRPHAVPLSPAALAILEGMPRVAERDHAFGSGDGPYQGFSKAKARLDKVVKIAPWRLHDLRRTTGTGLGEIGILPHVIEHVLNHVSGYRAGVAGIYQRHNYATEMREALIRWAEHVAQITTP
ncbi:integrase [Methylobacterium brachiatum]|uniref:Integrase n=1 Tax=Methylobacterium brachiatum TaxID=269660 RepID=A0AAJ1TSF7_9HYPH|nr:site-specific integrase [Methylobacterium brachiatum]MCB4805168.1 tyrosine-type recombinase/integrase [Methylobacterium brachiatum]MDQ0546086.1 integrase [Methylobacterium brachiatum]